MKILKEDIVEAMSIKEQKQLLNRIKSNPEAVKLVVNFIRNEFDENDAEEVEFAFEAQDTFDSYSKLDTIVRDKVISICKDFVNNSSLAGSDEYNEPSIKDILKMMVQKFGNKKCKYKLVAEAYERSGSGGVYTVTFYAPNDYIALFSMLLHNAPTVVNFQDEMDAESLQEYLNEYPTYESLLDMASANWWGDGDDFIISLDNLTTGETLYEGGDDSFNEYEDDDYDWDYEELEEDINPLKDAQDQAKQKQTGKGPFVKLDAGDVEHNTQAFNNAMGCESGVCESIEDIEKEEKTVEPQTINIRQALNEIDKTIVNSDLVNMYEACKLTTEDKQKLALMLAGQADPNEIYEFLASRCGDGYLHSESHIGDN